MKTAKQVDQLITEWKAAGKAKDYIVWQTALACVGWPYVFGARGEYCTVQNRHSRYSDEHPTIRTKCRGYDSGSCTGCQWYPGSERVRCYDCRGFTYWCLKQVGVPLNGAGATSQWNTAENWAMKGDIKNLPADTLVCLFVRSGNTMEHTGFGYNNETVEASSGVQHFTQRKAKWTHWAVPAGLYGSIPEPTPVPATRKTIRRGSKGDLVKECQTMLYKLGYDLGSYGIDGDFGKATEAAVRSFQSDHRLTVDGIVGPATWDALDEAFGKIEPLPEKYFEITIRHLTEAQANILRASYPGATVKEE